MVEPVKKYIAYMNTPQRSLKIDVFWRRYLLSLSDGLAILIGKIQITLLTDIQFSKNFAAVFFLYFYH